MILIVEADTKRAKQYQKNLGEKPVIIAESEEEALKELRADPNIMTVIITGMYYYRDEALQQLNGACAARA